MDNTNTTIKGAEFFLAKTEFGTPVALVRRKGGHIAIFDDNGPDGRIPLDQWPAEYRPAIEALRSPKPIKTEWSKLSENDRTIVCSARVYVHPKLAAN